MRLFLSRAWALSLGFAFMLGGCPNSGSLPNDDDDGVNVDADGDTWTVADGDCDDTNPDFHPGAPEGCDGEDTNCNGEVPPEEIDADGDGFAECEGDCLEGDATVYPGADELCDGQDNDCDGALSAAEQDGDGDGYVPCDGVADGGDCDDGNPEVHPGATEVCNGVDDDCDGALSDDEADADGDGYATCEEDCDDSDPGVHPDAEEQCNGIDDNCDGSMPFSETSDGDGDGAILCLDCDDSDPSLNFDDADGDGSSSCDGDCNEVDPAIHPWATEVVGNWIDEDCDGLAEGAPWESVLDDLDPVGDASGYLLDIVDYQAHWDGQALSLRVSGWAPFDDDDPDLAVDIYLYDRAGDVAYTLTYDNVEPLPGPLQLWAWDPASGWDQILPPPVSLYFAADTSDAMVLGVDLVDLGLDGEIGLESFVGVDVHNGYLDQAPDAHVVDLVLHEVPDMVAGAMTVEDADGDGTVDPGEAVDVYLDLLNDGYASTGANVTAVVTPSPSSTAAFSVVSGSALYDLGVPIAPESVATPNMPFEVELDPSAAPGEILVLDVQVTDDDGNSWSFETVPLSVGMTFLLDDPDDFYELFDINTVHYGVDGSDLVFRIDSYDAHDADQQVNVFLDTDLDGAIDYAISTLDVASGDYLGGYYAWVEADQSWHQLGTPSPFEYVAGSEHILFGAPLWEFGDPDLMELYVLSWDSGIYYYDRAPDSDMHALALIDAPYIRLTDHTFSEQSGNGDEYIDAGEAWRLEVQIENAGVMDSATTIGVLSSGDPDIAVSDGTIDFGTLATGTTITGGTQPLLTVAPNAQLSGAAALVLSVDADGHVYDLEIPLPVAADIGETTADAPLLTTATTVHGDTTSMVDDYDDPSSCTGWPADGYDAVVAVQLSAGQILSVLLEYAPGTQDAVVYISDNAAFPDLACLAGRDDNYDDPAEFMVFTAPSTGEYYVIADGYYAHEGGPFELTLGF